MLVGGLDEFVNLDNVVIVCKIVIGLVSICVWMGGVFKGLILAGVIGCNIIFVIESGDMVIVL